MRKVYFLLNFILIFQSCSSDENSSKSDFNVPQWLQGSWRQAEGVTFNFTPNDICSTYAGEGQCQKQLIDFARKGDMTVKVVEVITDNSYSAEIKYSNGQSTTYAFKKISNNSIEWTNATGSVFIKQ
ncbi:hypothetical protein ACHRV6_02395 [Flavobacterium sp. FlaQc-51]|uniref:hypothetical protein n=1 Tax=Flavobacterium sp. FlaQc-51 TaxID=3374184 RepID=UPI0037578A5D